MVVRDFGLVPPLLRRFGSIKNDWQSSGEDFQDFRSLFANQSDPGGAAAGNHI
jgi:hypothetical protein